MSLCAVKLKISSRYHPQTESALDVTNIMIERCIKCYVSYHQYKLDECLSATEFAYNSVVTEGLCMFPFETDLGLNPKISLNAISGAEILAESNEACKKRLSSSFEDAYYSHKVYEAR